MKIYRIHLIGCSYLPPFVLELYEQTIFNSDPKEPVQIKTYVGVDIP